MDATGRISKELIYLKYNDNVVFKEVASDWAKREKATLEQLLQNRDQASRMAAHGMKAVRERFSWDSMAEAYEELFLRIVAEKSAGSAAA